MRLPAALVASLLAAVVVVDVAVLVRHDEPTPYSAGQALEDFREQERAAPTPAPGSPVAPSLSSAPPRPGSRATAPAAAGTPAPARSALTPGTTSTSTPAATQERPTVPPGVYRYATAGHEEVDALGGSRHDYPAETSISYRRSGCGGESRWQPLRERLGTSETCRGPAGVELRRSVQRREFFGQSEEQVLTCEPGLVVLPDDPRPGRTFSGRCSSDDTVTVLTVRVQGVTSMVVGGRRVEVVHLRIDGRLTGSSRGTTQREDWVTRAGLLVRSRVSTETDRDTSAGTVHYSEAYELRLESLEPQR